MAEEVQFVPSMVFADKNGKRMDYERFIRYEGMMVKWGQLKLLLGTTLWLVDTWDQSVHPEIILVVAGGGSTGEHYSCLLDMFPQIVRADLWDSPDAPFYFDTVPYKDPSRVRLIKKLMTPENVKEEYKDEKGVIYFESDIRSSNVRKDPVTGDSVLIPLSENEDVIWKDSLLQKSFVEALNPSECLLKFRVPFPMTGKKLTPTEGSVEYLKGRVYKQCFTAVSSAEMRLACSREGGWATTKYDMTEFEELLSYYNIVMRQHRGVTFLNSVNGRGDFDVEGTPPIRPCFDTCFMLYVLDKYLYYYGFDVEDARERYKKCISLWKSIYAKLNKRGGKTRDAKEAMEQWREEQIAKNSKTKEEVSGVCTMIPSRGLTPARYKSLSLEPTLSILGKAQLTYRRLPK